MVEHVLPVDARGDQRLDAQTPLVARWLGYLEVDGALAAALLAKAGSALVGPVTLVLIASYLTPELQGYYYTFGSLLALQSFVELGFCLVITQFASHEWARLHLDGAGRITGDVDALSRLVSLGRLAVKWYAGAGIVFAVTVGAAGYAFLSAQSNAGMAWRAAWLVQIVFGGLQLLMLPLMSLLEGCNQIVNLYFSRLGQSLLANVALWATLVAGGGLWAAPVYTGVGSLVTAAFLLLHYRRFFSAFLSQPPATGISWRGEIWPMQWRLGLAGVVNYFAVSLFIPVMFTYHGPVVAGQMGMTLQVVTALQGIALAWIQTKVPRFGALIAAEEYPTLDRLFFRASAISLAMVAAGIVTVWSLLYQLHSIGHLLSTRLLEPLPIGLLLMGGLLMHVSQCQAAYLRAHKREPLLVLSVVSSIAIGLSVWLLGGALGPGGAGAAYLSIMVATVIWETVIWLRCRERWHRS